MAARLTRRSQPLPAGDAKARAVRGMFDAIAGRYDVVNRVMTFGMDRGWRRRAAATLHLRPGALAIDVACGTGDFCDEVRRLGATPVGVDFAREMLARARRRGVARLVQGDALRLPFRDQVADAVTCGFALRNVADLERLFAEIARVLKPGGRVALLETAEPQGRVMRAGHSVYFNKVVPLIGGLLSDRAAYRWLPRSVEYLPPPARLVAMLETAGFDDVGRFAPSGGIVQILTGARR